LAQEAPSRRKGSRIIDDTTKQIYGPNTSKYFFEKDVFYNREVLSPLDTFIRNYHRFNFVQRFNNLYQDLGNIGTSIRPIYYQTPENIGVTSGFNSFDLYWDTETVKYYDSKSPYTNMKVVIGGRGRNVTQINFTRNINPRWNFGFNGRWLLIDKQVQRSGKGDRNVKSLYYDVYTTYQSKDSTYRIFANFRRHHYQADEYGGILHNKSLTVHQIEPLLPTFFDDNAQPSLTQAESDELRTNLHIYQQYKLVGKGFQIYHVFDNYHQDNSFNDLTSAEPVNYFDYKNTHTNVKTDTVADGAQFRTTRNELGLKGNLAKLFYNGYYAIRQYEMDYKYPSNLGVTTHGVENYLGGKMELQLDSIGLVSGWAEIAQRGTDSDFRIEGTIKSNWFEGSIKQLQYEPTFLQQAYEGSHHFWNNSAFKPILATHVNGYLHYNSRVLKVSPGLTFTKLNNYVFFMQDTANRGRPVTPVGAQGPIYNYGTVKPFQSAGTQGIILPELQFTLTILKHITLNGQAIYSKVLPNSDSAIAVPDLFVNGQLSYANIFFHGNMDMHAGVDVHWKSTYDALAYDPAIQQFYRQVNKLYPTTPSFPIIDVFFNMKIKRGRVFLKYNNVLQAFTKNGYFSTPYYIGQRNTLDFGFDLYFFD